MENNIDKLLRNALENHEEMPPSESWMHIHTEIAKQNRRVLTPILAGLFLGVLLILGIGISMYYGSKSDENLVVSNIKTKPLFIPKNVQNSNFKEVLLAENNQVISKVLSSKILSPPLSMSPQTNMRLSSVDTGTHSQTTAGSPSENSVQNVQEKPSKNDSVQYFSKIKENINLKINETQPVELMTKSYVSTDLSEKMGEALVGRIDENYSEEKSIKTDSITNEEEGKKRFSLKHPIINFRLGMYKTSVNMTAIEGGEIPFANSVINPNSIYGISAIFNMAWKVNKKSRVSVNFKLISYSAVNAQSKSGAAYIDPLSLTNKPSGTFKYNLSKDVYEYLTPFGSITQPIDPKLSTTPKDFDVSLFGRFLAWQIGTSYEHDLIAFRHKKGGIPAMEVYGLVGINIQGMHKYTYAFNKFKLYDPKDAIIDYYPINSPTYTQTELGNSSPIVLGYNTGLGIRLQLSKRFGLNISGNYESNINSWVKDLPFTTRLSVLSVESGFFVNL